MTKTLYAVGVLVGSAAWFEANINQHWVQLFFPLLLVGVVAIVYLPTVVEIWWYNRIEGKTAVDDLTQDQ